MHAFHTVTGLYVLLDELNHIFATETIVLSLIQAV